MAEHATSAKSFRIPKPSSVTRSPVSRSHRYSRRRALATAVVLFPSPVLATVYSLTNQTVDLSTATYTADDTLLCSGVTFTATSAATLPAAINVSGATTFFSNAAPVTFTGALAGSTELRKSGTGLLTLTSPSPSFTGPFLLLNNAPLRLTHPAALGSAPGLQPLNIQGILDLDAALPVRPVSLLTATLTNTSPLTLGPSLTITSGGGAYYTVNASADLTFATPLPVSGAFQKGGTATLTYSVPTTYFGGISVAAGTLRVGIASPFTGSAGTLTVQGGATLDLNGFGPTGLPITVNSNGRVVNDNPASTSTLTSFPSYTASAATPAAIGGAGNITLTTFLPSRTINKIGTGTLTLNARSSFSSTLTVSEGVVRLGISAALDSSSAARYTLGPSGALDLNGFGLPPYGTFTFTGGALINDNTSTPSFLPISPIFNVAGGATLTLGGKGELIVQSYLPTFAKIGSGPLTINRYGGGGITATATILGGSVRPAYSGAILSGSSFNVFATGAYDLNGMAMPTGATVTLFDGGVVNNNPSTPVTLSAAPTYAGAPFVNPAFGGAGTLTLGFSSLPAGFSLNKVGAGQLNLPSPFTAASFRLLEGALRVGNSAQLSGPTGPAPIEFLGGSLRTGAPGSSFSLSNPYTLTPAGGTVDTLGNTYLGGTLTGTGTLTKAGTATLYFGPSTSGARVSLTVNEGLVDISSNVNLLSAGTLTLNVDNGVTGASPIVVGALAGPGNVSNTSIRVTGTGGPGTTYSGNLTLQSLTLTGSANLTALGSISSANVQSGTLTLGDGGTTGTVTQSLSLDTAGTLAFNRSDNFSLAVYISGSGTIANLGPGAASVRLSSSSRLKLIAQSGTLSLRPTAGTPAIASLSLAPATTLDVAGNLVLDYTGPSPADTLHQYLAAGQVTSAAVAADPTHFTLACAEASTLLGLTGSQTATWSGQTVDATSLLIHVARFGDANLNGTIDPDDYALLDGAYAKALATRWTDGDFNYDGTINQIDYLLIDTAYLQQQGGTPSPTFLAQRESQFGTDYVAQLVASVPEPSSMACLLVALPFLTCRRRVRCTRLNH